jgi:carboxymethylenebutenolidase
MYLKTTIMKKLLVCLLIFTGTLSFAATGKDVSYKSGEETVQAVLYMPKGKGPFPALIAVHEWWGLNDWIKEQSSRLADEGYVTLAVDLYRGKVATTPQMAYQLSRDLPDDRAYSDLHTALEFLKTQPDVKKDRIGVIGWWMGGGYALDMAVTEPTLAAVVINYGSLTDDPDDLKKLNASVLGIFAGEDRDVPLADVRKFEQQMKELGKKGEIAIYPDAGPAFENPSNTAGYRLIDAQDAWKKTIDFLANTLKK